MYSLEDSEHISHNVLGLSHMFETYMGEPDYTEGGSLHDIHDWMAVVITHQKGSVDAVITIAESKNKYYVEMSIIDTSFLD